LLSGSFQIDNLIIRNGGEFILPGATEKANITTNYIGGDFNNQYLRNSTISNSSGC